MNAANTAQRLRPAMAFFAIMMAFVPPVCSSTDSIGDWPQFHMDPQHEGASVSLAPHSNQTAWISENMIVWSYPAGGSSPAVAGGMVFTIGGGRVYAFGQGGAGP